MSKFAATSPWLNDVGGVYLKDNDISPINDEQAPVTADAIRDKLALLGLLPQEVVL